MIRQQICMMNGSQRRTFLWLQRRPTQPIISRMPPATIVPIADAYLNLIARIRCTSVSSENTTVYATVLLNDGV